MNWTTVATTVKLASVTAAILLLIGIPIAYWLTFSQRRWKFLVESAVALPLVLPPTVLGYYVLVGLGPQSWLGQIIEHTIGHRLPFTFEGLVVASCLYSFPFAVQPLTVGFSAVNPRLIEASWTLGVSKLGTFFRIILPQSFPGLLTAAVLSFAHTVGEFGVVLMVGGNIEGVTRTVSIEIYDHVQAFDFETAGRTATVLLAFSFAVLSTVYAVNRNLWAIWPPLFGKDKRTSHVG
ncbi:MAG: molybdate ABC transporter permease subunit [Nitrospira sp.]|nr:molybdate ABC transporter permease subunit [Nitrospira sp.]